MFNVVWSDKLESLADSLFDKLDAFPLANPLHKECVVLNSPVIGAWLKQYFLYDRRGKGRQRVLANWDTQYLYPFINDWLFRMTHDAGEHRNAEYHPYSKDCLQWRLFQLLPDLDKNDNVYKPLFDYIGNEQNMLSQRCFSLAGLLARMYDDYQVYRPEMLYNWQRGEFSFDDSQLWQKSLWQELDKQGYRSYLQDFIDIENKLPQSEIIEQYERITLFGVSSMPPVYLHFFQNLPEELDVDLYIFNPSGEDWYEDSSVKEKDKRGRRNNIQGGAALDEYMEVGNPLLSSLGKSSQEYLAEVIDRTGGNVLELFDSEEDASVLAIVQNDIKMRRTLDESGRNKNILTAEQIAVDDSIQIQLCHSPMREVEVLHDHIMKWFMEENNLQPHDIQVLVTDVDKYLPYINAVFSSGSKDAGCYVPHTIAESGSLAENQIGALFVKLLSLPTNRFKASEVVDILGADIIARAFELESADIDKIKGWIAATGIRWGIDQEHRREVTGSLFEDFTSWQRGLDRMMFGYAVGQVDDSISRSGVIDGAAFGEMLPYDEIEGGSADCLGRLMNYFIKLRSLHDIVTAPRLATEWKTCLTGLLDDFFVADNDSYRDIAGIKSAIDDFAKSADIADVKQLIPLEIVISFMEQHLEAKGSAGSANHNGVVFSSLRFMRSTPRKIICLLGMNDGEFPRADLRPCFDLLREDKRRCDRSQRLDDRNAFLEAVMSARNRFYISYLGRTQNANDIIPPSTLVSELLDYLQDALELPPKHTTDNKQDLLYCETLHRLQAFNTDYFIDNSDNLFSFSATNKTVAKILLTRLQQGQERKYISERISKSDDTQLCAVTIDSLVRFFRNPAEYFYKNILQVQFNISRSESLSDAESFEPNALDKYLISDKIMDAQFALVDSDTDKRHIEIALKEKGILPLDVDGHEKFNELWSEAEDFLNTEIVIGDTPIILRDIVAQSIKKEHLTFDYKGISLDGTLDVREVAGRKILVIYRYAAIKSKDLLRAWVSHLLFAQINKEPYTLVIGKDKQIVFSSHPVITGSDDNMQWHPIEYLEELLDLYLVGRSEILPFAPETSCALIEKEIETGTLDMVAATTSWNGGFAGHGERNDPYFIHAFGEDGPMVAPDFAATANMIFGPILRFKE